MPKSAQLFLYTLICSVLLSGCSIQRAQQAQDAQTRMIGMSKEKILACMGIPAAKASEGATEVWSYDSGNGYSMTYGGGGSDTQLTGTVTKAGNAAYANGSATTGTSFSAFTEKRFCKVNVVMTADHVTSVNYSGPTGGLLTKGEQCAFAVEPCLH